MNEKIIFSVSDGFLSDTAEISIDITDDREEDFDGDGLSDRREAQLGTLLDSADSDGDGLSDGDEVRVYHTSPLDADSDDDGVVDGQEWPIYDEDIHQDESILTFRIRLSDLDQDGLINPLDADSDGDGLLDGVEQGISIPNRDTNLENGHFQADADPSTQTDPFSVDTEGGGCPDYVEDLNLNGRLDEGESQPELDASADDLDEDEDGLCSTLERFYGVDPLDSDSDDDGVADGLEMEWNQDTDQDGLINALDPDSDNDQIWDGTEMGIQMPLEDTDLSQNTFQVDLDPSTHTDPLNPDSDFGGNQDGLEDSNYNGLQEEWESNPLSKLDDYPDADQDQISLVNDNCPLVYNPDQLDQDQDSIGDACDPDQDGNSVLDRI